MKRLIWLAILLPIIGWTSDYDYDDLVTGPAVTVKGLPACATLEYLKHMQQFADLGSQMMWDRYLSLDYCIILKSGIPVTITAWKLDVGVKYEFVFNGVTLYTRADALSLIE